MATYSRYRRAWRSGNYRTRGNFGRRWYGGKNKKYWGQFKAANQQRDQATMVLNSQVPIDMLIAVGAQQALSVTNVWEVLRNSPFYDNYSKMYDQIKMDSVRIKLTGSWMQQGTTDQAKRLIPTITTAFDRNGFLDAAAPAAGDVTSYSSCISKPWSLGSAFSQTRSIYTTTMQEKSQYIPTSSLLDPTTEAGQTCQNPCYNRSCISCPFKPIYMVHGYVPSAVQNDDTTLHLVAEFDICVTFRGLRKRPSAYDGVDRYLLDSLSTTTHDYEKDDENVYVLQDESIEFNAEGSVVAFCKAGASIYVATRHFRAEDRSNIYNYFVQRVGTTPVDAFYVFIPGNSS